jgi:hypothetical protein
MAANRASTGAKSKRVFGQRRKPAKMFRTALYARVSTFDQQSIPLQIRALREYAARRGWTIALQVKEVGSGASQQEQRDWLPSIPTMTPRKPSATGITGWLRVTCSEFVRTFHMNQRQSKSQPRWADVKSKLTSLDRTALLGLIQDLYSSHKDNQTFLHTRFGLGEDMLRPYKETIDRWLWPDAFSRQVPSVLKAKQAISNYKKAVGDPAGLAELMVFYCEQSSGFASDLGYQDESYLNALVRMFEQAVIIATTLPASGRDALVARLDRVRTTGHERGYGVGDDMDSILAKHAQRKDRQSKRL